MARKDWSAKLDRVTFRCGGCDSSFSAPPDLIEDDPETEYHPYRYFAHCPHCGAQHQPQAKWERSLMAAHQAATGPRTPEGKAAAAANLAGHPTPEEAHRTRFNAMKHGMNARVATFFPAKPDGYAFCGTCDVDRHWCQAQPACVKQTEIFMLHHAAVEQRNPKHLGKIHADLIAAITSALQMCLQEVLGTGVVIKTPRVELSREGHPVTLVFTNPATGLDEPVYEYMANPVFKPITDLITRLGLSMNDLGLTVKAAEGAEDEGLGTLKLDAKSRESLETFNTRMLEATQAMRERLGRAGDKTRSDPVFIEHQAQGDGA
ncbi:MAG TPA: hypothetical protein VD932_08695 [Aquabacterium sp.]|nr:hypothetical protein [Aquabacterium sp.]